MIVFRYIDEEFIGLAYSIRERHGVTIKEDKEEITITANSEFPMVAAFKQYVGDLCAGPRGGDDDTYDYWPASFDLALKWAEDLDKSITIKTNTTYREYPLRVTTGILSLYSDAWELG